MQTARYLQIGGDMEWKKYVNGTTNQIKSIRIGMLIDTNTKPIEI